MALTNDKGKAATEQLEALHGDLAEALSRKVKSADATAADLAVARQFLKDNGIESLPTDDNKVGKLANDLPFPTDNQDKEED